MELPPTLCKKSVVVKTGGANLREPDCVDPNLSNIMDTELITLCDGTQARGEMTISNEVIKAGVSIGGVVGTLILPDPSQVIAGTTYGPDEMPITGNLPECANEGEGNCMNHGAYRAIDPKTLPSKIVSSATAAGKSGAVVLPGADDVRGGVNYGPEGSGKSGNLLIPAACTSDGAKDCVVTGSFAAAATTGLASKVMASTSAAGIAGNVTIPDASHVARGVGFGIAGNGVTGTRFAIKQCRNAVHLATWDTSGVSNLGDAYPIMTANGSNVLIASDELNWNPSTYALVADFPVQLKTTSGILPGGLTEGTTYYVIPSGLRIKLAVSQGGAPIDITSTGSGSINLGVVPDFVADQWDTIDEYNRGFGISPGQTPGWSSSLVCDTTNFENISSNGGPTLSPSNAVPSGGTSAFSEVWRDNLSGLNFTNILYDGVGSTSWASAVKMCIDLNSGDGVNHWHLPTQKELMQLYIDGIANLPVSGGAFGNINLWSATLVSSDPSYVWRASLANGRVDSGGYREGTNGAVICVR
jgi:hypothetical protein